MSWASFFFALKSIDRPITYILQNTNMNKLNTLFIALIMLSWSALTSCQRSEGSNAQNIAQGQVPALHFDGKQSGTAKEWESLMTAYDDAVKMLNDHTNESAQYLKLAQVYITAGRLSGENSYYNTAAFKVLDHVLTTKEISTDDRFLALALRSGVLLSVHRFPEALKDAEAAYAISKHNAQVIGALVDANVELGNYAAAVAYCDEMVQLRPDIRSYSRISYLRQLHGDLDGAIDAMMMAVEAGLPGTESTEWARVTLGELLLMKGDTTNAGICFDASLELRPDYPFAIAGKAKYLMARGAYAQAKKLTENAITIRPETAFVWQLADIESLMGNTDEAQKINERVLDLLLDGEKENADLPEAYRHNGMREVAAAYLRAGDESKAIAYAKKDLSYRPDNYDANELMAWALFQNGDTKEARMYANKVIKGGLVNPVTAYRMNTIIVGEQGISKHTIAPIYSDNYLSVVGK